MDGCPISFGPKAVLPFNPGFVSGLFEPSPPGIAALLTFDTAMNQTSLPANPSWDLIVDALPIDITDPSWDDQFTLRLQSAVTTVPTVSLTIELIVEDDALHSLSGMRNVLPFGPTDIFFT